MKPTIHVIAPFHTILNDDFSHCAFTGKALRFSKMMRPFGYQIIEYANAGSTSAADVKHVMLKADEYRAHFRPETSSPGAQANVNTPGGRLFGARLIDAIREHARPGDIVAHIWTAHPAVVGMFPGLVHVETGIGYPNDSMGNAYRIFESEAWRHYHWGRIGTPGGVLPVRFDTRPERTWIVPNYFDLHDWPFVAEAQNYVAFMSRFVVDKGIELLRLLIKAWCRKYPATPLESSDLLRRNELRFAIAGMGDYVSWVTGSDFTAEELARIDYKGIVTGKSRAALVGNARAFLLPSTFVEPFGGAAVEAMLCGTPAITSDLGAFTETIDHENTGFRCRTIDEYVDAIERAGAINRAHVREMAELRFSFEACGEKYHRIFQTLTSRVSVM